MSKSLFITAISTNIGKTVISAIICKKFKDTGYSVCYYKPIQTGCYQNENKLIAPDIEFIKSVDKDIKVFSTYLFRNPCSPHLASKLANETIILDKIKNDYQKLKKENEYIVIEGAGGLFVPINENGIFIYNIPKIFNLPVVLVSYAGLGAINQVGLSYYFLVSKKIKVSSIILLFKGDRPDYIEEDNCRILRKILKFENIFLLPEVKNCDTEKGEVGNILDVLEKYPNLNTLRGWFY